MSAIQISTTEVSNYALRINEAIDYPNQSPTILLDACPSQSELVTVESKYTTGDTYIFDTTFSSELYMSNALKFRFDIPIDITLTPDTTLGHAITEETFMADCFNDCNDICVSQFGLIQALQSCQVSLNGKVLNIPTQISECINILSQYYNSEDVAEWFPASQPDMFQDFNQYSGNKKTLKFIDESGEEAQTCFSPEQDNNIFACKYTRGYMSRTPIFKWISGGIGPDAQFKCKLKASFFTYLPLSFGSVPDKITSLIGINQLRVQMTMKPGMMGYLFNTKGDFFKRCQSIEVDKTASSLNKADMLLNLWGQPNGTVLPRGDNGLLAPYSIQFPDIQIHTGNTVSGVKHGVNTAFNYSDIQCNTVPKAVYVAMVKLKEGQFEELTKTPINYGLINSLELSVSSLKTNYSGVAQLSYLADTNNYDAFTDTLGRLTKGYAVKLDLTKDLSIPGVTCVGASGLFRITVRGTFMNQGYAPDGVVDWKGSNYQLVVLTSLPSSLDFDGANFNVSSGVLIDSTKLMSSEFMRSIQYNYGRRMDIIGAGLWSSIKNGAVTLAKNAWANRHQIAKTVGDVAGVVKTIRGGERFYSNVSGAGSIPIMGAGATSTTEFFPRGAGRASKVDKLGPEIFKRK